MKKNGFTILELIMAMAIFAIIGGVVIGFFSASFRILYSETNKSSLRISVESAVHQLTNELTPTKAVTASGANSITFWNDKDFDSVQDTGEVYSYALSSGKLVKTVNSISKNLLYGVTAFSLTYDGTPAANVRVVTFTLTATSGVDSLTIKDQIRLRNKLD